MKKTSNFLLIIALVALSMFIAACSETKNENEGSQEKDPEEKDTPQEEITIRWAYQWGEEHFNENIGPKLKEKFPHITFEIQDAGTDHPDSLENLVAAKKTPDIVSVGTIEHLYQLEKFALDYNMDDLIKEEGFDLNRIEPALIANARNQDPHKEQGLYAIPYQRPTWSLHYNKDIFDKLGVEYPEDGITWEAALELGRKLTQEIDGFQYRGLDFDTWYASYLQFGDNSIDPETNEVIIDKSEPIKRSLQYIDDVVSIPGNYPVDNPSSMLGHWGELLKEGNIAMNPGRTNWEYLEENANIDIVTFPVWEGYEGIDPLPHGSAWAITEPSEYKKEALEIFEFLLSDELQKEKSENGEPSILKNTDIHAVFGDNKPELADKHLASLFKNTPAIGPSKKSKYSDGIVWKAGSEFVDSGKDINEFIRVIQEIAEENVRSQMESE